MQHNTAAPTTFYRLPKVREICGGVSASTVWSWVKRSDETGFPRPIKLSENCTAWNAAEIEAWAQARVAASRARKAEGGLDETDKTPEQERCNRYEILKAGFIQNNPGATSQEYERAMRLYADLLGL